MGETLAPEPEAGVTASATAILVPTRKPAISVDAMKQWAARYRLAAIELTAQKRRELQALGDDEAARRADILIESARGAWVDPRRQSWSGLVEQQRIFQKLRLVPPEAAP